MDHDADARCHFALFLLIDKGDLHTAAAEIVELQRVAESDPALQERVYALGRCWRDCCAAVAAEWDARLSGDPLPRAHSPSEYERITLRLMASVVENSELCEECRLAAARAVARRQADAASESPKGRDAHAR
jgi:hypothetical protein